MDERDITAFERHAQSVLALVIVAILGGVAATVYHNSLQIARINETLTALQQTETDIKELTTDVNELKAQIAVLNALLTDALNRSKGGKTSTPAPGGGAQNKTQGLNGISVEASH